MRLCRCGAIVVERCERCQPYRSAVGTTKQRGYGHDHRQASERYRNEHPLCECCVMTFGPIEANVSEHMHHIVKITDSPHLRMDWSNWLAVCQACHEQLERDQLQAMKVKAWSVQHYIDTLNGEAV